MNKKITAMDLTLMHKVYKLPNCSTEYIKLSVTSIENRPNKGICVGILLGTEVITFSSDSFLNACHTTKDDKDNKYFLNEEDAKAETIERLKKRVEDAQAEIDKNNLEIEKLSR